jgi:hypothetical protein
MNVKSNTESLNLFKGAYFSKPIQPNENHYLSFLYFCKKIELNFSGIGKRREEQKSCII